MSTRKSQAKITLNNLSPICEKAEKYLKFGIWDMWKIRALVRSGELTETEFAYVTGKQYKEICE